MNETEYLNQGINKARLQESIQQLEDGYISIQTIDYSNTEFLHDVNTITGQINGKFVTEVKE